MSNVSQFLSVLGANGQDATYHREQGGTPCPCLTPEGYPDMEWHEDNPTEPMHNEQGKINPVVISAAVKAFVQPIQSTRATRLSAEYILSVFGDVQADDHLGIFPLQWGNTTLDFYDWSQAGEDFVMYDGRRFLVVNANKIPDPSGGGFHHWEVGLRLMKTERPHLFDQFVDNFDRTDGSPGASWITPWADWADPAVINNNRLEGGVNSLIRSVQEFSADRVISWDLKVPDDGQTVFMYVDRGGTEFDPTPWTGDVYHIGFSFSQDLEGIYLTPVINREGDNYAELARGDAFNLPAGEIPCRLALTTVDGATHIRFERKVSGSWVVMLEIDDSVQPAWLGSGWVGFEVPSGESASKNGWMDNVVIASLGENG